MAKAITGISKKKRRGRPKTTGVGVPIMVRIQPYMLAALDRWIGGQEGRKPTRPEAVRKALSDWLIGLGLLKPDDLA